MHAPTSLHCICYFSFHTPDSDKLFFVFPFFFMASVGRKSALVGNEQDTVFKCYLEVACSSSSGGVFVSRTVVNIPNVPSVVWRCFIYAADFNAQCLLYFSMTRQDWIGAMICTILWFQRFFLTFYFIFIDQQLLNKQFYLTIFFYVLIHSWL